jgi:hypothetical protein
MKRNQIRKWLIMGTLGCAAGGASLLLLKSLPIASGTAISTIILIVVLKHLALALMAVSPLAALFQTLKPAIRRYCPWPPDHDDS